MKRQLMVAVTLLVSALLVISLYFSFSSAKHEVKEVYDARLGQSAKLMLLSLSLSPDKQTLHHFRAQFNQWMQGIQHTAKGHNEDTTFGHSYEQNIVFQFYRDGQMLWTSVSGLSPLSLHPGNRGFADVTASGVAWRTFQLSMPQADHGHEYIVVAEKQSIRHEIIGEIALSTAIEQLLLLPMLLGLLLWLIGKNFRPIQELRAAITQRSAHHLDRIDVSAPTVELAPLVDALNRLLTELELAWQREKRFTRAAAHELKTPLTILRLNVENALESNDPAQLRQSLQNIFSSIDRTDRLIHQLLMQAKVESLSERVVETVSLLPLLQTILADMVPLALRQQQEISLVHDDISDPEALTLPGDPVLLEVLFRNLIDNAIRYSGEQSDIQVSLVLDKGAIEVRVADNGPEISPETRERIFEAFYRGHSEKGDGAGLGMSICKDIATSHHATLTLMPRESNKNTFVVRFQMDSV